MWYTRLSAIFFLLGGSWLGYFVYSSELPSLSADPLATSTPATVVTAPSHPFRFGLDLAGGTHLVYGADVSSVPDGEEGDAMETLRDVIERRVNLFGVAESIVQVERPSIFSAGEGEEYRLIVELPGVTDTDEAIAMIGETPVVEFRKELPNGETELIRTAIESIRQDLLAGRTPVPNPILNKDPYASTGLTGRFLDRATLEFDGTTQEPVVSLVFNAEGAKLFEDITRENVGKTVAIYLDGAPISEPTVREAITGGKAVISGAFTREEAKLLVGRLNSGALPIDKLSLLSTETIGPSLGEDAKEAGVMAGAWGVALVALFLVLWYRLPGVLAVVALGIYSAIMLSLFKVIPVTLTAAGIAGFVLSIGLAVDANVLIFERMKEELRKGKAVRDAVKEGFSRAWFSIRDSNISSILSGVILFWFGTSLVEGFALTFMLGILVSMFSAITVTRPLLLAVAGIIGEGKVARFLFGTGVAPVRTNK